MPPPTGQWSQNQSPCLKEDVDGTGFACEECYQMQAEEEYEQDGGAPSAGGA